MFSIAVIVTLALLGNAQARSLAQFNATFVPTFTFDGLALNNSANNVTDLSGTNFFAGSQLAGSFISSAENFTIGGRASNSAIFGDTGAATNGGFDAAATNFGGSVTNTTGAFSTQSAAANLESLTTGQAGLTSTSTGTSVFNNLLGLSSQAGFESNGVGVGSGATFLGGSDVGGLLPNSGIGAITGALVNPTGTAAGCSGASQTSFLYGAGQTTTGCNVQSVIAPTN